MDKQLYFSLFSGDIYELDYNEKVDAFQIPLQKRPDGNCSKCFGRFYTSYNTTTKHYVICNKCARTCVDVARLYKR